MSLPKLSVWHVPIRTLFCVSSAFLLGGVASPAVASDPNLLVFSARYYQPGSGTTTHYHLYTIRPNGHEKRQWTSGKSDDTEPEWLPDGHTIRFHRTWQNRPSDNGWCELDTHTQAIRTIPEPPKIPVAVRFGDPQIKAKIEQEIGKGTLVALWGKDRYVALSYQGKKYISGYGPGYTASADVKELRIYNGQGELQKTIPVSLSASVKSRFTAIDRPINHLQVLTPIPNDDKRFLLGVFSHRAMVDLQLLIDTTTGQITYWSSTRPPEFSPDSRWFYSVSKSGEIPRGYDVIGKRRDGSDLVEYVGDLYLSHSGRPDRQRSLVTGKVDIMGTDWCPLTK